MSRDGFEFSSRRGFWPAVDREARANLVVLRATTRSAFHTFPVLATDWRVKLESKARHARRALHGYMALSFLPGGGARPSRMSVLSVMLVESSLNCFSNAFPLRIL